jgi:tRNA(fMet)-specific endonuclease VapC
MIVPAIVMFELEYGCAKSKRREQSRRALEIFLSAGFDQPAFDIEDAREAGEIRAFLEARGQPIGPCDILIAAQARRRGARLVTLNIREFERVPGLGVEDWAP